MKKYIFTYHDTTPLFIKSVNAFDLTLTNCTFSFYTALSPQLLRRIPREGFSFIGKDAIKLFHVSDKELAEAKKMDAQLQPIVRSYPAKHAAKVDKKLGFNHKIINSMNS